MEPLLPPSLPTLQPQPLLVPSYSSSPPPRKRQRTHIIVPSFPPTLESWKNVALPMDNYSLFPTLLLHIGYLLSKTAPTTRTTTTKTTTSHSQHCHENDNDDSTRTLEYMVSSWRNHLVCLTSSSSSLSSSNHNVQQMPLLQESIESVHLLKGLLKRTDRPSIIDDCLTILLQIVVVAIAVADNESHHQNSGDYNGTDNELLETLLSLAEDYPKACRILDLLLMSSSSATMSPDFCFYGQTETKAVSIILQMAAKKNNKDNENANPIDQDDNDGWWKKQLNENLRLIQQKKEGSDEYDTFLKLVCHSKKIAEYLSEKTDIVERLSNHNDTTALCKLARSSSPSKDVIQSLERSLLQKEEVSSDILISLLDSITQIHDYEGVVDRLDDIIVSSGENRQLPQVETIRLAAELMCGIIARQPHLIQHLVCLLETTADTSIWRMAVECVTATTASNSSADLLIKHPLLLRSVCRCASHCLAPPDVQSAVVDLLYDLSSDEGSNWSSMAREPKLVQTLIAVASRDTHPSRDRALEVMMRLSKPATNHHLLAKEHGFLSCWIRYVRSMEGGISNGSNISSNRREVWKERLMELALVL